MISLEASPWPPRSPRAAPAPVRCRTP